MYSLDVGKQYVITGQDKIMTLWSLADKEKIGEFKPDVSKKAVSQDNIKVTVLNNIRCYLTQVRLS